MLKKFLTGLLLLFVLSLLFNQTACADVVDGYGFPSLVFPVSENDDNGNTWKHDDGSYAHVFKNATYYYTENGVEKSGKLPGRSDVYALDLNLNTPSQNTDEGLPVRPIASGVVEKVASNYGYVLIKHSIPITTSSTIVNKFVEKKEWYSGYMHMDLYKKDSNGKYITNENGTIFFTSMSVMKLHLPIFLGMFLTSSRAGVWQHIFISLSTIKICTVFRPIF